MLSDTVIAAIVGGGVAAILTGGFAFWNQCLARRGDERRQIRELAVSVALENWKIYKAIAERRGGGMQPIDVYLIHAMYLVSALDGRLKTPEQIREHLKSGFTAAKVATAEVDEYNKDIRAERESGVV